MYRGGFADVWKYQHQGREVAVKVLRVYATSDLEVIIRVGHQRSPFPALSLTRDFTEVLQGIHAVEGSSASKRVASSRSENDRE